MEIIFSVVFFLNTCKDLVVQSVTMKNVNLITAGSINGYLLVTDQWISAFIEGEKKYGRLNGIGKGYDFSLHNWIVNAFSENHCYENPNKHIVQNRGANYSLGIFCHHGLPCEDLSHFKLRWAS